MIDADVERAPRFLRMEITRAVGSHEYVEVDTRVVETVKDDRFLLCTDGLHGYLTEPALDRIMAKDVQEAVLDSIRFAATAWMSRSRRMM